MLQAPFYDPLKSYDENYTEGPFNAFADGVDIREKAKPRFVFCGIEIQYPFGIPAGPLLNSKFVTAAFQKGFDVAVYKTVRATAFPTHPYPNVLGVVIEGDLTLERAKQPLVATSHYTEPLSITNSFGVGSREPKVWQEDAQRGIAGEGSGQIMVLSCMGTVKAEQTPAEFVADFAKAAELATATSAKVIELNLSCPNIGNEGLVCYDLAMTRAVAEAVRGVIGSKPLILKVGYYKNDGDIEELVGIAKDFAQAIASINTIAAPIVNEKGEQALPGSPVRLKSGVCGASIKWAGLEMTEKLAKAREKTGAKFAIVGTGGVTVPKDFKEYREAGANVVMSATGAMWNPYLAKEIKAAYQDA